MSPPQAVEFAFADPVRRVYLALNREGDGYHFVHPIEAEDMRVLDGLRRVSELTCECRGGRFRGTCYVTVAAQDRERAAAEATDWFDSPAGAGESVEAFRG